MNRIFVSALVASATLIGPSIASAGAAVPGQMQSTIAAPSPNDAALERVGACIAAGGAGDVLMLIDTSGSLQQTDPSNARVSAAKYLVNQLTSFAATNKSTINVAVAGFSDQYDSKLGWTKLGAGTNQVNSTLDAFSTQNTGADTDYWTAMTGARKALAQQSDSGGRHCSMLVLFTDGEYSIEPRDQSGEVKSDPKPYATDNKLATKSDADQAVTAGKRDLCRATGLADQVRTDGITTIAVGLAGGASSSPKPDFSVLRGMSVGEGGTKCGDLATQQPGAFFEAKNIDDLFFAFDQFATPGQRPVTQSGGLCTSAGCPAGSHSFVVDSSIGRVHALAKSTIAATSIILRSPSGKLLPLKPGSGAQSGSLPGAGISWTWVSPQTVSFDLKRTDDKAWTGQWMISFVSSSTGGKSESSLHLSGDITPVLTNAKNAVLRTNESVSLNFGVTHLDGGNLDPTTLSDKTVLSAELIGSDGQKRSVATGLRQGAINSPRSVSLDGVAPGAAVLRLVLNVTTKDWKSGKATVPGTSLEPQVKDYALTVLPPASYPTLPSKIDLGTTEGTDAVTGKIPLSGDGCAWVEGPAKVTGAPENVSANITSSANSSADCASGSVPLSVKPSAVGNGLLAGTVTVMVRSKDAGAKPVAQQVAYRLEMQRPANQAVFWPTLIGLTLLGLLIPLGMLYVVRFATTRLRGGAVTVGSVRGSVNDTESFLTHNTALDEGSALSIALDGQRSASAGDKTFRARMGLAPTELGSVVVEQPRKPAAGVNGRHLKESAQLPLALANSWMVSLDPASPHDGDVEVTFLVPTGRQGWSDLLADAIRGVPDVVRSLRAGLPAGDTVVASDGWGGGAATGNDAWGSTTNADPWGGGNAPAADPWGASTTSASAAPEGDRSAGVASDPWGSGNSTSSGLGAESPATDPWGPAGSSERPGQPGSSSDPWA